MAGMAPQAEPTVPGVRTVQGVQAVPGVQTVPAVPRRARRLVPAGLPRRGELIAACTVAFVLVHLLLAQLTLLLVLLFAVVGVTTRWRRWWLLWPALAGAAWALAVGPDQALAGFTAGPASLLRQLGAGGAAAGHPLDAFSGIGRWLPRQFPVALPLAAAEAAALGWLAWLRTDEWAVPPPRPGAVAALRAAVAARVIRSGSVLTRDGCALGTTSATGAVAELRWPEVAHGVLITAADGQQVTLASLQLVHAALRRRKAVFVLDDGSDRAVAAALAAACRATGTPLRHEDGRGEQALAGHAPGGPPGGAASASQLWGRAAAGLSPAPPRPTVGAGQISDGDLSGDPGIRDPGNRDPGNRGLGNRGLGDVDLTGVLGERSAVLLAAWSPELADRACAGLTALAARLRRIGVDGDALVWAPQAERLPPQALGALLRDAASTGLAVLAGTTSPAAATELAGLAGTALVGRVTDAVLAAALAARTGSRLLPPSVAAAFGHQPPPGPAATAGPPSGQPFPGQPPGPLTAPPAGPTAGPPPWLSAAQGAGQRAGEGTGPVPAGELVPCPVVPARVLLTLGHDEFVLAVSAPRPRQIAPGRLVPARLPRSQGAG
jgi:hypothetical protein